MLTRTAFALGVFVVFAALGNAASLAGPLGLDYSTSARQFGLWELKIRFPEELGDFQRLPDTQVHDACDADRDGVHTRLTARFAHESGAQMTVPGFAMRERPGRAWQWRVRWSARLGGQWKASVFSEARFRPEAEAIRIEQPLETAIAVIAAKAVNGPLIAPGRSDNPRYLRQLRADGTSKALWLFGACRAWVVKPRPGDGTWAEHEWLDRKTELFPLMRKGGFNLLNQWMAPWEYWLVHHDRAEFWREADGSWKRIPLAEDARWTPYQVYDQGRALAFDKLVKRCEGGPGRPTVYLLISPMPHQCLQAREHPWGAQESGWSAENDGGKQTMDRLNGFSGLRPDMTVWEFFEADPTCPLDDWRSQLFDHHANFFRYLIARWGYSRAVGVWVIMDEMDAVGDEGGYFGRKTGWWAHPQCGRWLANVIRMFRGELIRSDGMKYQGDPYRHPIHAAATSYGGQAQRGGNLDWDGGPAGARPDLLGWHWYPVWREGMSWSDAWAYTIDGIISYSTAPIGSRARLISEFGWPDRGTPEDVPYYLYPTLYHHGIWAAIFSGQGGTPMDWDDGKEYGELRWRRRKGIFDREHYPIDHVAQLKALRRFLGGLQPDGLVPCLSKDARVTCVSKGSVRILALHTSKTPTGLYGWLFTPDAEAAFSVEGLTPGQYRITWSDPWTGIQVTKPHSANLTVGAKKALKLDAGPVLKQLRLQAKPFPAKSRLARGQDVAFKLEPVTP